jgi:hypothetical protein
VDWRALYRPDKLHFYHTSTISFERAEVQNDMVDARWRRNGDAAGELTEHVDGLCCLAIHVVPGYRVWRNYKLQVCSALAMHRLGCTGIV